MTYKELFEEFTSVFPVNVIDYRPFAGKETIIVWTRDGKSIIAKRIGNKNFEIKGLDTCRIYTTVYQIGKNAEKIVYNHNKEKLCDSDCIWKITEKSVSFSDNGGLSWVII